MRNGRVGNAAHSQEFCNWEPWRVSVRCVFFEVDYVSYTLGDHLGCLKKSSLATLSLADGRQLFIIFGNIWMGSRPGFSSAVAFAGPGDVVNSYRL
jgi:hypothetical protein